MSRTNIIALLIFGAILGYFLSFGTESTRKFKAGVYQLLAPFLTSGSGLQKQITSVRTGLKSLEQLERENAAMQVENRTLRATNQGLRDVEHEVNRLRHALNYRERSVFKLIAAEVVTAGLNPLLNLNFLSKQADLKPGQKVYTSGVGGVFPSGLLIGLVKNFRVRELDGQGQLAPAVDLSYLEDVFVVTGRK